MLLSLLKDLFVGKSARDDHDIERANALIQSAHFSSASRILDNLIERSPNNSTALLLRGAARRLVGNPGGAIADLVRAQELGGDVGDCCFEMAMCWAMLGDNRQAIECCEKVRKLVPSSTAAFSLLAHMQLPGDYYFDVLSRIVSHLAPKTYVEIGVCRGESLQLVKSASVIIGIDPEPKISWVLEPHMKVFPTTSDAFFAEHDLRSELGGRHVDLAFIDGMHQFEFAMRDLANVERYCHKDSVILLHDCYPLDEESAGREPRENSWSGDIWRLLVLLKKYRPDLHIHTIGTAPTGLAIIQNLNPASTFLLDNQGWLYQEFLSLDYSFLHEDKQTKLNLFPNDWSSIERLIPSRSQ
jgi:hypothetical protein